MRRLTVALALIGGAALAGCGALNPYPTAPRVAKHGQPAGPRVAICYNRLATSLAEVMAEAQQQCPSGTTAERVDTDWYLQNCPLLLPARGTFVCTPAKK